MDSYEKILSDNQESVQQSLEMIQKSLADLTAAFAASKIIKTSMTDEEIQDESVTTVISPLKRAHIPFPSFDGSNFREWKAKAEQIFELKGTPENQRSRLLLLSMDGKAFAWQRHYMQNIKNTGKSWQQ